VSEPLASHARRGSGQWVGAHSGSPGRELGGGRADAGAAITDAHSMTTSIGFVGLGHMGGNMAARLFAAGHPLYGTERNRAHAQGVTQDDVHWVGSPREVAESADVLFTSLPDDGTLDEVASGTEGILAGLTAGKVWVDMSTVSPHASRRLAERVRARGAIMLDAPVSGSVPQVKSGTLTIMVGGDEQAYARVEPILRRLGTPTLIGANGQGLVLKLAINISLAVQMLAFSEGMLLAARAGVDPKIAAGVMTSSPIGSPMLKARAALVLDLPEEAWFDVGLMQKDVVLALDAARRLHVPLPSAAAADEVLTVARAIGYEHRDLAALYDVLGHMAGTPVEGAVA
jgi:3-hydroxyisobutyrate dehydrogenase-like beta-hydroxyacid dehydrogenase